MTGQPCPPRPSPHPVPRPTPPLTQQHATANGQRMAAASTWLAPLSMAVPPTTAAVHTPGRHLTGDWHRRLSAGRCRGGAARLADCVRVVGPPHAPPPTAETAPTSRPPMAQGATYAAAGVGNHT